MSLSPGTQFFSDPLFSKFGNESCLPPAEKRRADTVLGLQLLWLKSKKKRERSVSLPSLIGNQSTPSLAAIFNFFLL